MALLGWVPASGAPTDDASGILPDLQQPRFVHNKSGRFESRCAESWCTAARIASTPQCSTFSHAGQPAMLKCDSQRCRYLTIQLCSTCHLLSRFTRPPPLQVCERVHCTRHTCHHAQGHGRLHPRRVGSAWRRPSAVPQRAGQGPCAGQEPGPSALHRLLRRSDRTVPLQP